MTEDMTATTTLTTILLDYLENHPDLRTELRNGETVAIGELELQRQYLERMNELGPLADYVTLACTAAVNEIAPSDERFGPGRIVITKAPINISALRSSDLGRVVSVHGLVKSVTEQRPHYHNALFQCARCGHIQNIEQDGLRKLDTPLECPEDRGCGRPAGSTRFHRLTLGDVQNFPDLRGRLNVSDEKWLEIQEPPGEVEAMDRPRSKVVRLVGRHLSEVRVLPGDMVTVTGILDPDDEDNKKIAPPTFIDGTHVEVHTTPEVELIDADRERIEAIAASDDPLTEYIIPSIAPHVMGHDEAKMAIACQLFGGVDRTHKTKRLRGTIHVLLLGDPSTAKSELQRAACALSPRGIFTNSTSSTKVGLTAAAVQEKDATGDGKWVLRAGPVVMADRGICGVDEIGELNIDDWKALEEAMEQQTISVTKADIHTILNARTAMLLAGNPKGGERWDEHSGVHAQVDIPPSSLSRIDLLYIMLDTRVHDQEIRDRIAQYHGLGDEIDDPVLSPALMRGYITLARHVNPELTPEAKAIFDKHHAKIREVPHFTIRTFEAYIRIGEALARMRLASTVTEADAQRAVDIHHAGWSHILREFTEFRVETVQVNLGMDERIKATLVMIEQKGPISFKDLEDKLMTKHKMSDVQVLQAVKRLESDGRIFQPTHDHYQVV